MIPALRHARRISAAALGLGAAASLAMVGYLAVDAPASSAAGTQQSPTTTSSGSSTASPSTSSSSHRSRSFSSVPSVSAPSATQQPQAQTHSS